ncbi:MAG: thioesterase domain-containing protein, partial [Limisphaerales bacterium]
VYGVQAVGWDGKQPRHTTTEAMAAHYVKEIRSLQPEGPYHVAGYSLGSVIAFEVAQQLAAQGQTVGLLALLDGLPQNLPWRFSLPIWLAHYGRQVVFHFRALVGRPLRERWSYFGLLKQRLQSHWLLHQRGRSGKKEIVTAPQLAAAGANLGDDYFRYVVAAYHPKPYPGSALLIVPQEAPVRTEPVWRHLVRGPLAVEPVPGDHRSMVRNPAHVAFLATALNRHLESIHRGTTPTNGSGTAVPKA